MRIKKRFAATAAAGALAAGAFGLIGASPAQAAVTCSNLQLGYMCVHVHDIDTDTWTWLGPWYACTVHDIPDSDMVTWVSDDQYTGTITTFYGLKDGENILGTVKAQYDGRPPGYVSSWNSSTQSIRVC